MGALAGTAGDAVFLKAKTRSKGTVALLEKAGVDVDEAYDKQVVVQFGDLKKPAPPGTGEHNEKAITSPRIEVPAWIRYTDKTEAERMKNVVNRIPQIVADYFQMVLMPFHKKVLDLLFNGGISPDGHPTRMVDILLPTEHGKSTLCCVVFPILSLMNDPNAAHIICGTNQREAKRWLAVIENHLTTNKELLRDYPWLEKPKAIGGRLWSKTELTIAGRSDRSNANPSIVAIGQGSGDIRGRRGKFLGDDLEGAEAMYEAERTRLYDWMMLEALRTYEDVGRTPRPLFANVGTPYDVDSIHFRLADTGEFAVYKQPYRYEKGTLIWPQKREKIAKLRHTWDDRQFAIAMELNPKGSDESVLSMADIQQLSHATKGKLAAETGTFVSLDPASGSKKRRADYAGLAVLRIEWTHGEPLPQVEVLEAYKVRDEAIAQVHEAARLARQYTCPVIVETNAMQQTYRGLFQHFASDVRVITHFTTKQNKYDNQTGLTIIKTLIRNGRFKMVETKGWDHRSEGMRALAKELRDLGTGAKDHISMASWFAIHHMYSRARNRNLPRATNVVKRFMNYRPGYGTTTIDLSKYR